MGPDATARPLQPDRRPSRARVVGLSLQRLGWIARVLAFHGAALAIDRLALRHPRLLPAGRLSGPERLRSLFEDLGGTFVKFGQMLAMQPDVLPLDYCDALLKLLDRIEPFPYPAAEQILRAELGRGPDEIFADFGRVPIATASVGQVYAARLQGLKVAVKIQRPHIEIEFANDVRLLLAALWLIRWLHIRLLYWLQAPTSEFVAWSAEELDYRHEARYSEELRRHATDNPIQYVPRVVCELTSRRTLVVEFLDGITLLDFIRARDQGDEAVLQRTRELGFDRETFASNIIGNFLGDAFRHGIYHADLHPANLMILRDNVVGYIDFGITGLMSRYSRRHLILMTLSLTQGDLAAMYSEYLAITSYDESSDLPGFRAGLTRPAAGWYEDAGGTRRLKTKITRIFSEMLQLSRQTNVMPERDIVKYIRSAIYIDGLLTRFVPGFDIGLHIGASCTELFHWEARWSLLTPENLLDWGMAGGRLLAEGPVRTGRALDRLGKLEEGAALETEQEREDDLDAERSRAVQIGAAIFGASVLVTLNQGPPRLGVNLWTAELAFLLAAFTALAGSLRRLIR